MSSRKPRNVPPGTKSTESRAFLPVENQNQNMLANLQKLLREERTKSANFKKAYDNSVRQYQQLQRVYKETQQTNKILRSPLPNANEGIIERKEPELEERTFVLEQLTDATPKVLVSNTDSSKESERIDAINTEHNDRVSHWRQSEQIKTLLGSREENDAKAEDTKEGNSEPTMNCRNLFVTHQKFALYEGTQSQRIFQTISLTKQLNNALKQIMATKKGLQQSVDRLKSQLNDERTEYNRVSMERETIESELKRLFEKSNELRLDQNKFDASIKCNESELTLKQSELKDYTDKYGNCHEIMKGYSQYCRNAQSFISELGNELKVKWDQCEQQWYQWSQIDVFNWIRYKLQWFHSKDRAYDVQQMANAVGKQQISGENLETFDLMELAPIGFIAKDRSILMDSIPQMLQKYPNPIHASNGDTVDIPTEFVCKLSKKIMNNPVYFMIDGCTYERSAIDEYLSKHHCSPETQEPVSTNYSDFFIPDVKLKSQIKAYQCAHT